MAEVLGWIGNSDPVVKVKLNSTFGINAPDAVLVEALSGTDDPTKVNETNEIDKNYWFEPVLLKKLLRWVYGESARRNLMLIGDAGVGKSSIILELAARLGVPVYQMACSGKTRFAHFVGSREMVAGTTKWVDGHLTKAMREGGIFLMDEVTRLDPGEQMNLTAVLDGRSSLTIPDTGEVVKPHARFRVVATGNTGGFGDESGAYVGEKPSSFAFLDRFQKLRVLPMPVDVEMSLIQSAVPGLPIEIISAMVRLGEQMRKSFVGAGGGLSITLSPRSMMVWAQEAFDYQRQKIKEPVWEALMDTTLNGAPERDIQTVSELYNHWLDSANSPT